MAALSVEGCILSLANVDVLNLSGGTGVREGSEDLEVDDAVVSASSHPEDGAGHDLASAVNGLELSVSLAAAPFDLALKADEKSHFILVDLSRL